MNTIKIWAPRFHDMKVLIKGFRVQNGMNRIVFTKTWLDKVLLMDGAKIKSYPMENHGKKGVYVVPVADFDKEPDDQLAFLTDDGLIDVTRGDELDGSL